MSFRPPLTGQVDALITDDYLDSLLAARERRAADVPSVAELDPDVRFAAAALAEGAARVHPSFRFGERLAARLADAAAGITLARAAGESAAAMAPATAGGPIDLLASGPIGTGLPPIGPLDLLDPARPEDDPGIPRRPLIIGGTLASAALSIAGAAIVAWRHNRAAHAGDRVRLA
ncbi:MAG: hypothetical protein QOF11_852 [Chloroflexota bacterium]|nr:hypothetical protein [Chloroflexota bacterium]